MRVALAQINTTVGDLEGNVQRCEAAVATAQEQGADLVVLPEMAIPGYPPRDILLDPSFPVAIAAATDDLAQRVRAGPAVAVGTTMASGRRPPLHPGLYTAAVLLQGGETRLVGAKRLLPAYDVFHEPRWFLPGPALPPVEIAGRQIGFLVCEDMWDEGYETHPGAELVAAGADLLVCLAASPYRRGVLTKRLHHARRQGCPLVYVNLCGANDELIMDGRSFVTSGGGDVVCRLAAFEEEVRVLDLEAPPPPIAAVHKDGGTEELFRALVLGVRDFCHKNRLARAHLGLSGGIDSAVVACIAAEALGPERVTALANPSRYTDPRSTACAREWAGTLGIGFEVVELEGLHVAAEAALGKLLEGDLRGSTAAENVQARLRALIWMTFVNRYGGLLLNCSNKTELSLGYATLYGDMAGGLCPVGDLTKLEVIELARWIDAEKYPIPRFILERAPSAELRPGQVDPFDYAVVAPGMERLVGLNRSDDALRRSEHKRWQMGVILKVSEKAFGTGRLIPITRR